MAWEKQYDFADTADGLLNSSLLQQQIIDSSIDTGVNPLIGINGDDTALTFVVMFTDPLSGADETVLDGVVAAHEGTPFVEKTQSVESVGQSDTGLNTLQDKINQTSGPLSPGKYLLTCYCELKTDGTANAGVEGQVSIAGAVISEDNWDLAQWHAYQCSGVFEVTAVQAGLKPVFMLQYRRIGAAATVSIRRARASLSPLTET